MYEMLVGIASGIAVTLIVGAYTRWLRPMFDSLLHAVPRLNKTEWLYEGGTLEVSQTGTRIRAKARRTTDGRVRDFKYNGKIIGGQVVLTWEEPKQAGYTIGAMVLKLTADGQKLEGKTMYVSHELGTVICADRSYSRA